MPSLLPYGKGVFPSLRISTDPRTLIQRRHHVHSTVFAKHVMNPVEKMKSTLSLKEAQKIILLSQGIHKENKIGSGKEATYKAIETINYVQIVSISVVERVLPSDTDTSAPSEEEYFQHLIINYLNANAIGTAAQITYLLKGLKTSAKKHCMQMCEDGLLITVTVENQSYLHYLRLITY